jgi:NTP pyrophosphatase (non-canonical NTP hydrolase)
LNIKELQADVHMIAVEKGWHEEDISFGEYIALFHSELSEALEYYRAGGDEVINITGGFIANEAATEKPTGIPIELADVIIRILDFCEKYHIDMQAAIDLKMEYNKTRSHRHGGKVI